MEKAKKTAFPFVLVLLMSLACVIVFLFYQ